jgi:hypothetical protein
MLVLTYNFATANSETTTLKLQTLTTAVRLVYLFQNCELKQEPRTFTTKLHQPLKFHNRERSCFFTFSGLGELFLICGFGANFCFNSKPSFSFESIRK